MYDTKPTMTLYSAYFDLWSSTSFRSSLWASFNKSLLFLSIISLWQFFVYVNNRVLAFLTLSLPAYALLLSCQRVTCH